MVVECTVHMYIFIIKKSNGLHASKTKDENREGETCGATNRIQLRRASQGKSRQDAASTSKNLALGVTYIFTDFLFVLCRYASHV